MPRTVCLLALALLAPLACDKSNEADAKPKPAPFTGKLTPDLVMASRDVVKPLAPWDEVLPAIEAKLGKPTKIDGKDHSWAVIEGDKCAYLTVEKNGDKVGTVDGPGRVDKMMKSMFDDCAAATGAPPPAEAAEDPDAPGPPADGSAVEPSELLAGVAKAKSKWLGKKVKLTGSYVNTTKATATGSDEVSISLSIRDEGADVKDSIGCSMPKGSAEVTFTQGDMITVEGTVTDTFGGGLDECTIVAEAAGGEGKAAEAAGDEGKAVEGKAEEAKAG